MATLTTLELLSPPADVVREVQAQIAAALQQDASNSPGLMATAFITNIAAQSVGISVDVVQPSVAVGSDSPSPSSEMGGTLINSLADPQVTKRANEEVCSLADSIRSARNSFEKIRIAARDIDSMVFYPIGWEGSDALSRSWSEIPPRFERALQASIQVAPMAISSMNSVKDILGSASRVTGGELKARLQVFMRDLKVKEAAALDVKNQFQNVVDRLRTFWANVEIALVHPMANIPNRDVLKELGNRIAVLTNKLDVLQRQLGMMNSELLSKVATGCTGAAMTIYQLCPSAFSLMMNGAFGTGDVGDILKSLMLQIGMEKEQLESTRREMTQEQHTQSILQDPKSYLNEVALKLDTVVKIWQTINLDMHGLYTDLSNNVSDDAPITGFFHTKIKVAKEIYEKLAWLLERYVEQLSSL